MENRLEVNQQLIDLALRLGATKASVVRVADITFSAEFRQLCAMNSCGLYGKCWMCPPDVGEIEQLIAKAQSFDYALVYQTIGQLKDSFDIEGMLSAGERHNHLVIKIAEHSGAFPFSQSLNLGSGGCSVCESCAKRDNQPCRFPDRAISSLEAYCIQVSRLAAACGMPYHSGENTITNFGAFLFDE